MSAPKKADITIAKLRDLKAELKEEHGWRMRLREELNQANAVCNDRIYACKFLSQRLEIERGRLGARLIEIELSLRLLGQPGKKE